MTKLFNNKNGDKKSNPSLAKDLKSPKAESRGDKNKWHLNDQNERAKGREDADREIQQDKEEKHGPK